ncbi:Cytochrome c [Desulfonatronum thiosulfatophilum]|uniref:Cytochrome c n=1 Tax=Desulfonatronum thiosulfatophilum TaxID=617002 RepID=A0A1G6D3H2_9BACT|nr:cytochrome c [Desulfonatronum thiosulfatophilum]SDB39722.1 Cytochrome c [Desulfonatronum thiosulfatophilum]
MRKTLLNRTAILMTGLLLVAAIGFGLLRNPELTMHNDQPTQTERGASLFREMDCSDCHSIRAADNGFAPGMKGLFDRDELPSSGRPVTEENIRTQLVDPIDAMPSYADRLTEEEMDHLISFLKTL